MKYLSMTLLACSLLAASAAAQEILTVNSRPGVTQSVFIARVPENPAAVALLFPGGGGNIRIRTEDGRIRFGPYNFVVRARTEFIKQRAVAVIFDAPSDQSDGMDDPFRFSEQHATDVAAVIAELKKRFPELPFFIVGTSRGTVSAASLGRRLPDAVAGVVLTSSLFIAGRRMGNQGLSGFDFAGIKPRLLFAHHRHDGCAFTPYRSAAALASRYPLISVSGGLPPRSQPCDALSEHGFLGREAETVEAIVNWMLGKPYRDEIN